jgi:Carboxylesterase family
VYIDCFPGLPAYRPLAWIHLPCRCHCSTPCSCWRPNLAIPLPRFVPSIFTVTWLILSPIGLFPNISIDQYLRAYHASEIRMVFGTYVNSKTPPTLDQIALSNHMQKAWVDFARNPATGLASNGLSWPRYDGTGKNLVLLGNRANLGGASFTNGTLVDRSCTAQRQTQLAAISAQLAQLLA